jgi:hypothetical protein
MRSLLMLALSVTVGCGSRTIGDGFDIDTNIPEDGAVTDTGSVGTTDSIPPGVDTGVSSSSIRCGMMASCTSPAEDCCLSLGGAAECRPRGTCGRGAALSCSSPANCGGQVCCLSFRDGGARATCQPMCGGRDQTLCETDADCTMGRRCRTSMIGGVRVCQ